MSDSLPGPQPATAAPTSEPDPLLLATQQQLRGGANWFLWIAGLSLVNSLISLGGGGWSFLAALGVTQVVDAIAFTFGQQGIGGTWLRLVALAIDLVVAGFVAGIGLIARKGNLAAFVVGMALYLLDGLLLAVLGEWPSAGFHLVGLYGLYRGLVAARALRAMAAAAGAPSGFEDRPQPWTESTDKRWPNSRTPDSTPR